MIQIAKEAGADAVKFQSFKTENIILPDAPKSSYHIETTGTTRPWYDILKTQELDRKDHEILMEHCQKTGIMFLSTPYDEESADLLEDLNVPAFKVASTDANNIPFLRFLAKKNCPIIMSTGMCTLEEVRHGVNTIMQQGCEDLILLHCTSNYPARLEDTNLMAMVTLRNVFRLLVGISDHTLEYINPIAATALGAAVYEKHFTIDKNLPGPDHKSSLSPDELKQLVSDIRRTELSLGTGVKEPVESEKENLEKLRKNVVAKVNIPAGTVVTKEMLTTKRSGRGLPPLYIEAIVGKKAKTFLKRDTVIMLEFLE